MADASEVDLPEDCRYTREDEWVRLEDGQAVVGVTDYAQQQLGEIVFVELPAEGAEIVAGQTFGVIESVKAVSDLYTPLSGTVAEANPDLGEQPELINESCYEDGWMLKLTGFDTDEFAGLLDADAYRKYLNERED